MRIRWIAEAIGTAVLLVLPYFAPLLFPGHMALYHHYLSFSHLVGGLLLDMLALFLLGLASLASIHRFAPARLRPIIGAGIAGILIWRTGNIAFSVGNMLLVSEESGESNRGVLAPFLEATKFWAAHSRLIALVIVVSLVVFAWKKNRSASLIVRAIRVGLASFAFCSIWIVAELTYCGYGLHRTPSFDRPVSRSDVLPKQRIVWVLFDELSHDLIFEHPARGERFPVFERMWHQSVSLDNIEPLGMFTDKVVPSLLIDRRLEEIRSTFSGQLLERDSKASKWGPYHAEDSLFGRAHREGWRVGIAGWYNPYCRIFNQVLTSCQWTPGIPNYLPIEIIGASEEKSAFANALAIPRALIRRFLHPEARSNPYLLQQNIRDYYQVMQNSKRLIQNSQLDFIFLHLPVPHPPGIYSRTSHRICECGDYFDNLELADSTLSELQSDLQSTSLASNTILIISSDHSWRVPFWRLGPDWSQEEEGISHGSFEQKPVFLVHFPGQTQGNHISTPVSELVEHDLIEEMLDRKVENLDALTSSMSKVIALPSNSPRNAASGFNDASTGY